LKLSCYNFRKYILRPKFFVAGWLHTALAFGTGLFVPYFDAVAAALQTEAAGLGIERGSDIADDTAGDQRLDGVAVGTRHGSDVLAEKTDTLVIKSLVTTREALIFNLPTHLIPIFRLLPNIFTCFRIVPTSM